MSATPSVEAPLRVLLVEDDPGDVLLCREAIGQSNLYCQLSLAGNLRDAVDHLANEGADVALVDLSLPDAQDLEAVTTLAQRFDQLPVVVLTGLPDEQTAARALHAGAEDYLVKGPGSRFTVGRAVRYAIERKRAEQTRRARDAAEAAKDRAEQTARELERKYRQLFDCNPYPMYVFDTDTLAFLEVNDAAATFYGYARQDLLGLDVTRLYPADDVAAATEAVASASTVERVGPLRHVRRDGTTVEVNITSHVLSFDGRRARCAVIEDVTEREQLDRRVRQSQRLESLGQLAGGVAHDFNNLLGIIVGYATMCSQDVEAAAHGHDPRWHSAQDDLKQIIQAGDRATNLTRQLLSFARAEISQTKVIDLNAVVTGVELLLRRTIGEDIDMTTRLTSQPWLIKADPGQIEQVLFNLVVNARDAMPTGGAITIDTAPVTVDERYAAHHPGTSAGRYMRLRVTDTGTGMSQATIDRAFEPFFTTKPKGQGTGLGLATIYGIVTQAGGYAQISSEPGAGTTFAALFPATREVMAAEADTPDPAVAVDHTRERTTILLAEDEDSLRLLNQRILTRHGYTVIAASSGPEALDLARQYAGAIDLLLTDVIMPHMSGHELAIRLQAINPTLPVIYVSGYAEPLLASRSSLPAGVTLLSKPVTEDEVLATIRRALDTRPPDETSPTSQGALSGGEGLQHA
jgi:PAS domain S-box-containing protein